MAFEAAYSIEASVLPEEYPDVQVALVPKETDKVWLDFIHNHDDAERYAEIRRFLGDDPMQYAAKLFDEFGFLEKVYKRRSRDIEFADDSKATVWGMHSPEGYSLDDTCVRFVGANGRRVDQFQQLQDDKKLIVTITDGQHMQVVHQPRWGYERAYPKTIHPLAEKIKDDVAEIIDTTLRAMSATESRQLKSIALENNAHDHARLLVETSGLYIALKARNTKNQTDVEQYFTEVAEPKKLPLASLGAWGIALAPTGLSDRIIIDESSRLWSVGESGLKSR